MIPEIARAAARRFGDAPAYVAPEGWAMSYNDVDRLSDRVAAGFTHRGVGVGDVVALVVPPGIEYLVGYIAAAKIGAVTAGVNDRLALPEQAAVLGRAEPRLVLTAAGAPDPGFAAEPVVGAEHPGAVLASLQRDETVVPLAAHDDRAVAIVFTSGTTGQPKGALYTNRQLSFITATDVGGVWGGGSRALSGTSFAHLGFMTKLPGNLMRGGTTFIMRRWRARAALELIARERMNTVAGVPTQLALMLAEPDFDAFDLAVQYLVVGGAPITPATATEARARFGARLATRYSCTEAGIGLGTAFDDPEEDAILSVGRPHPAVDLVILDDADGPVPTGDVGQVCLRSPAVMAEYWHDPAGTRAAFTDSGHVRTGDLGWIDDRGRLRLVGRNKEMYVRGGYNVYPVEVEAVLSTHSGVAAVAVIAVADPVMGEIGVAVVVAADPASPPSVDTLREFARSSIAAYKLPDRVEHVDALPLTAGDKIDRRDLARIVADLRTDSSR